MYDEQFVCVYSHFDDIDKISFVNSFFDYVLVCMTNLLILLIYGAGSAGKLAVGARARGPGPRGSLRSRHGQEDPAELLSRDSRVAESRASC